MIAARAAAHRLAVAVTSCDREHPSRALLRDGDHLLDNLRVDEIVETVRCGPLESAAEALLEEAARRMSGAEPEAPCKPDDLTFVLFRRGAV